MDLFKDENLKCTLMIYARYYHKFVHISYYNGDN